MGIFAVEYMASLQKKAYEAFGVDPLAKLRTDDARLKILDQLEELPDEEFDRMFTALASGLDTASVGEAATKKDKREALRKALHRRTRDQVKASVISGLRDSGWAEDQIEAQISVDDALPETATMYEDNFDFGLVARAVSGIQAMMRDTEQYRDFIDKPSHVHFGTLPIGDVNARVLKTPLGGDYLALFNNGLFRFTYLLGKVIGQALDYSEAQDSLEIPGAPVYALVAERPQLVRRLRHLLGAYVISGHPGFAPRYTLGRGPSFVASRIAKCMITFLVGHEYGHVIRGDLETAGAARMRLLGNDVDEISFDHEAEFAADYVALDLMARTKLAEKEVPILIEWAPALLFVGLHLVRSGFEVLQSGAEQKDQPTPSHPTIPARLHQVAAPLLQSEDPALEPRRERLNWLLSLMGALWRGVKPAFEQGHELMVAPAKIWLDEKQARSRGDKVAVYMDASRTGAVAVDAIAEPDRALAVGDYVWLMGDRRAAEASWRRSVQRGHAEASRRLSRSEYLDPNSEVYDASLDDEFVFSAGQTGRGD